MKKELDIAPLLSTAQPAVGSGQRNLHCPCCGCINTHTRPPYLAVTAAPKFRQKFTGDAEAEREYQRGLVEQHARQLDVSKTVH